MCYNGAPVLSRNGIYFFKAVRSYGNILLWGIVVVSAVPSPFIMILWHRGEDTLWEIPTQRQMPDIHTYCAHTHTYACKHICMHACIWVQRHGGIIHTQLVCSSTHTHTVSLAHIHSNKHLHRCPHSCTSTPTEILQDTCCIVHTGSYIKTMHTCAHVDKTIYRAEVTRAAQ